MGKLVFTKDGIFKKVIDPSGKSRVFTPINQVDKQSTDIKQLASQLAEEIVAKLLGNLPVQNTQQVSNKEQIVDIDNSIAPTKSDDISVLEKSNDLGNTNIVKDKDIEQAKNRLKELKNRK